MGNLESPNIYQFMVRAVNKAGYGPPSEPTYLYDVPAAPNDVEIISQDEDELYIKWSRPDSDWGAPIDKYQIEYLDFDKYEWIEIKNESERSRRTVIEGFTLYNGDLFRVRAGNKAGFGPSSEPVMTELVTTTVEYSDESGPRRGSRKKDRSTPGPRRGSRKGDGGKFLFESIVCVCLTTCCR